jgi:hypothetical protein
MYICARCCPATAAVSQTAYNAIANFSLLILDTPEHVDSEKPNRQIDLGPSLDQLFSKRDFYFIKCS